LLFLASHDDVEGVSQRKQTGVLLCLWGGLGVRAVRQRVCGDASIMLVEDDTGGKAV
jgi:hypothetical protein